MITYVDIAGKTFGMYKVIEFLRMDKKQSVWLCQCECGTYKELKRYSLIKNSNISCGCNKRKFINNYEGKDGYMVLYICNKDTQEIIKEYMFDVNDYDKVKAYYWVVDTEFYACSVIKADNNKLKRMYMHRLVMDVGDSELEVDHININRYDNRKTNLRICSSGDNLKNKSLYSSNTSGITGVHWHKLLGKWRAQINCDKNKIIIGKYTNKEDAIKARLQAEKEYFGEFAPQKHLYEQYGIT